MKQGKKERKIKNIEDRFIVNVLLVNNVPTKVFLFHEAFFFLLSSITKLFHSWPIPGLFFSQNISYPKIIELYRNDVKYS